MAMAMGRIFTQGLIARNPTISISISPHILTQRHRSGKAHQAQLIELDLDSSSTTDGDGVISGAGGIRKLEEVIQNIIARRAAPDWLPFLPGYSYWVPPTNADASSHPTKFIEVVEKLSAAAPRPPPRPRRLTLDETMSFRSNRGWPSSSYFIEGTAPSHPVPMELEVEVKICDNSAVESSSENEEG